MTYALLSQGTVVRIPDAWTVFTIDGTSCQRRADGAIVAFVGERWRAVDTNRIRFGPRGDPHTQEVAQMAEERT